MKQTITGPGGLKLILDPSEIFPDDPGAGTPAIVEVNGLTATFWCALDTGELDCGSANLTPAQMAFLNKQEDCVGLWLTEETRKIKVI